MAKKKETTISNGDWTQAELEEIRGIFPEATENVHIEGVENDGEDPEYSCCVMGVLKPERRRNIGARIGDGFGMLRLDGSFGAD